MCGISGIVNLNGEPVDREALQRMADTICHRGPDDYGFYFGQGIGLAHRRLSIIDLATGGQPLSNEDKTLWIVFNGEIYNHLDLRSKLIERGHRYQTRSDTETIIHAYEEWGEDCLRHFRGMFAFALWDARSATIFLARDRFGVKPLYYVAAGSRFLFASEIKSLLATPWIRAELNQCRVPEFLAQKFISGNETLFLGIRKLLPGHYLKLATKRTGQLHPRSLDTSMSSRRFWDIRDQGPVQGIGSDCLEGALRSHLETAVRYRLISDVPLGLFLSGGIDSTILLSIMSGLTKEPIQTFAVGFEDAAGISELPYARIAARAFRAVHHETVITADRFFRALPRLVWHEDEPIAFPSSIPLYFVSELARQSVKVVLSGEGSDELFAGYNRYRVTLWNMYLGRIYRSICPNRLVSALGKAAPRLRRGTNKAGRALSRTFLARTLDLDDLYFDNFATFARSEQKEIFTTYGQELLEAFPPYQTCHEVLDRCAQHSFLNQLLYLDIETYLVELLMKQDQMSMAASLESRVPFLDHMWAGFVWNLPDRMKIRGTTTKYLLRRAFRSQIPHEILKRTKKGFPVPLGSWLRQYMSEHLQRLLLSNVCISRGLWNVDSLRTLLMTHLSGARDHTDQLWTLLNFELWCRIFLDGDEDVARDTWMENLQRDSDHTFTAVSPY